MNKPIGAMLLVIVVLLSSSLIISQAGLKFTYVNGSSMAPTYSEDCSIVYGQETETVSEGDIIVYESEHFDDIVIHRVVEKYDQYNQLTAKHRIVKSNQGKNQFVERGGQIRETNQQVPDTLQNETVYIAKGDNNTVTDPELIQEDQVRFVANNNDYPLPTDQFCG